MHMMDRRQPPGSARRRWLPLAGWNDLLGIRTYRLYITSSTLGAFASTVQFLGLGWLVLEAGETGWALAGFLAVRFGVKAVLAIPSGLAADRYSRPAIYAWMRVASGGASALGAVALLSPDPLALALLATALSAASHAFDLPAHRALQGEVQPDSHLDRAMSFGTSCFHAATLLGPVVAFPLASTLHPSAALSLSAVAFFVAAVPAFGLRSVRVPAPSAGERRDMPTAVRFVVESPVVLILLIATTLPAVLDKAVAVALPSQHGSGATMGFVLAAPELGAIAVGLVLTSLNFRFASWVPLASGAAYTAGIVVASLGGYAAGIELIAASLFLAGCAKTTLMTSALAAIQRRVPIEMRGRIFSI